MKEENLVSIVVTVYNKETYIKKCLESISQQTYSNLQVIVINDGSTDKSLNEINNYIRKDKRIKVFTEENSGLPTARNFGLGFVQGSYVCFIDGDDYIKPNYISDMMRYKNFDLVISGFSEFLKNKKIKVIKPKSKCFTNSKFLNYLFNSKHYFYCVLSWNKLFNFEIIKHNKIQFKNFIMGEDVGFLFDYLPYCKNVKVISNSNYCNVLVPNTLSRKVIPNMWEDNVALIREGERVFKYNNTSFFGFMVLRSIKVTLGNYSVNYHLFKESVKEIRHSNIYKKLTLRLISEKVNKIIYILVKLNLCFILYIVFKKRNS